MVKREGDQSGFGTLPILFGIMVVIIIIGVGLLVYRHDHKSNIKSDASTSSQQPGQQQSASATNQPVQTATQYLTIKEWGVQIPLTDSIKDAYYVVPTGISPDPDGLPSGVILGLTSLNVSCGTVAASGRGADVSLGGIVRVLPTATDPVSRELYTQLDPGGATINGYYYGFGSSTKGSACAPTSTFQAIDSAFSAAVKGMVSTTSTTN